MHELMPLFLFLAVASLGFFSFLSVTVWVNSRTRERRHFYQSEVLKKVAEATSPEVQAAALALLREQERFAQLRRREGARLAGATTLAIGVALMIFLQLQTHDGRTCFAALIPIFAGAALLAFSFVKLRES